MLLRGLPGGKNKFRYVWKETKKISFCFRGCLFWLLLSRITSLHWYIRFLNEYYSSTQSWIKVRGAGELCCLNWGYPIRMIETLFLKKKKNVCVFFIRKNVRFWEMNFCLFFSQKLLVIQRHFTLAFLIGWRTR